ncbi:hypothetical protein P280DRAFT_269505 [Massarina eburnea CBS 473.64]|uniref:Uncharacterized protein n=1 Tax=Massarina eburnea CBS 473.64 TaxID=1395130 RepID=A0A6A6S877_9PLEO|nr:hypothetical protein P280DRAFT_269505 [Massarina eburnea CBS 473.64]
MQQNPGLVEYCKDFLERPPLRPPRPFTWSPKALLWNYLLYISLVSFHLHTLLHVSLLMLTCVSHDVSTSYVAITKIQHQWQDSFQNLTADPFLHYAGYL